MQPIPVDGIVVAVQVKLFADKALPARPIFGAETGMPEHAMLEDVSDGSAQLQICGSTDMPRFDISGVNESTPSHAETFATESKSRFKESRVDNKMFACEELRARNGELVVERSTTAVGVSILNMQHAGKEKSP